MVKLGDAGASSDVPPRSAAAELEAAIAKLTALIGATDDPGTAAELVAERKAMRGELADLRREEAGNVVCIDAGRRR